MTIKIPALIPDRKSASGFRVEYLSVEIDPKLAQQLTEDDDPTARRMRHLADQIRNADFERVAQLIWLDKDLIVKALKIAASTFPQQVTDTAHE
jgi:hypothetical protein